MAEKLTPERLLEAYAQGFFPMGRSRSDPTLYWFSPDPRAILPLEAFHLPTSLAKTLRRQPFEVRVNTAFPEVMAACAAPRASDPQQESWINGPIRGLYEKLWLRGCAHSVECWGPVICMGQEAPTERRREPSAREAASTAKARGPEQGQTIQLLGGLYGVSLGGAFFGESMFSRATDASKVALAYLVEILRQSGYTLLDVQYRTEHLSQFGIVEIAREDYLGRLESALRLSPNPSSSFSRVSASVIRTSPSGLSVMRSPVTSISNSDSSPTPPPESK